MDKIQRSILNSLEKETKEQVNTFLKELRYSVQIKAIEFDIVVEHQNKCIGLSIKQWHIKEEAIKDLIIRIIPLLEKELDMEYSGYELVICKSLYPYLEGNYTPLKDLIDVSKKYYDLSYEKLTLTRRSLIGIEENGTIKTVGDLLELTKGDIIRFPHIGERSVEDIIKNIKELK